MVRSAAGAVTDDLAAGVHRHGEGGDVAAAEIDHPARRHPRERVVRKIASGVTVADDVAAAAQRHGEARAADGAEIDHPARRPPPERMLRGIAGCRTIADAPAACGYALVDADVPSVAAL